MDCTVDMHPRVFTSEATEVAHRDPRELFCPDFDLGCFDVADARLCKRGVDVVLGHVRYFTLPVLSICPLCDRLP